MMQVDYLAKRLIADPGVRRNFRVIFPDGERADLTSSDVEDDTVRLTESVCSETVFKYGCCERSMIEFEAVGVENILGCRIRCGIEFDTSGLSAYEIQVMQSDISLGYCDGEIVPAEDSDLGWGYWRMPYGSYWVTGCHRDHSRRNHRTVTAYTADPTVMSEVERVRLQTYIPGYTAFSADLLSLAAANIAYQMPGTFSAWGWEDSTGSGAAYLWADIQALGASESATFSSTADGHTYSVTISGTYALVDWHERYFVDPPPAAALCHPASVRLQGWDTDEAWTWYNGVFEAAGAALPVEAAHTRLARTYLQPHIGQDKNDQYGPYDHAPVYWLPDGGCPFFIEQLTHSSIDCSTFTRLMWDVTATFSVDGVQQAQRTFFPVGELSARVGELRISSTPSTPSFEFPKANTYTSGGVEYYNFAGAYDPVDILSQQLEIWAREIHVDRHGVPWLQNLTDRQSGSTPTPPQIPAEAVEELFWDDAEISPIGQVQYQKTLKDADWKDITVWDVDYASNGGQSIYTIPSNIVLLRFNGFAPGNLYARRFLTYLPDKPLVPFEAVVHEQPWLEPGDYVTIETADPETPTLRVCVLAQTITGIKDLRQEISATGGTVYFEGNAFDKDVTMIFGAASGGGAAGGSQASGGGGGGGDWRSDTVTYRAWDTVGACRIDASYLMIYLPCTSLKEGNYSVSNAVALSVQTYIHTGGVVTAALTASRVQRASPDLLAVYFPRPSNLNTGEQGTFALRGNISITAS